MVGEFFIKLLTRAKEVANALKAKFNALTNKLMPAVPVKKSLTPSISSETGNAMKMGKRYRLTSGHAPIFSLYTFFGNR
jgi:predicted transcriptional regulator